jgi:hypothetical protein
VVCQARGEVAGATDRGRLHPARQRLPRIWIRHLGRADADGDSLARLLDRERSVRNRSNLPPLTEEQIVAWAREYQKRTGAWPNENSGPIRGEDWANVNQALRTCGT